MSTSSYPIQLNLRGRRVLVVGAGEVATRKVERLLGSGAALHVVALEASPRVRELAAARALTLSERAVRERDVEGCLLVITATDDGERNAAVARWTRAAGGLVSRVDNPHDSDFSLPAAVRTAHLEATVSTYGQAPSASRRLRRELEAWARAGPERFVQELVKVRSALRGQPGSAEQLRSLGESGLYEACVERDDAKIHALVQAALAERALGERI